MTLGAEIGKAKTEVSGTSSKILESCDQEHCNITKATPFLFAATSPLRPYVPRDSQKDQEQAERVENNNSFMFL
ncbi:MAG: hypothetical protein WD491_03830, partial [Balneolales bacterium]